jgi:hypothetical protein
MGINILIRKLTVDEEFPIPCRWEVECWRWNGGVAGMTLLVGGDGFSAALAHPLDWSRGKGSWKMYV